MVSLLESEVGRDVCSQLYTLLIANASMRLGCSISDVAQRHADSVAYRFADRYNYSVAYKVTWNRCYTASDLLSLSVTAGNNTMRVLSGTTAKFHE